MDRSTVDRRGWPGFPNATILKRTLAVIARVWSAQTGADHLQIYVEHFSSHVLPALKNCDGYVSATVLTRQLNNENEIVVTTFWKSMEAIEAFAGTDRDRAVVAAEAAALLTTFDHRVLHYTVAVADGCEAISRLRGPG
jgi:heme-degrading monooxygenase HmoA